MFPTRHSKPSVRPAAARPAWWFAILATVFGILLPLLEIPAPTGGNDTVFVPPALDFALGRPMSALILKDVSEFHGVNPDRWLAQPPLFQQILGTWLRVFGISNASMRFFMAALSVAICGALLAIMRRFKIHSAWIAPAAVMLFVLELHGLGLRPEICGMTLLVAGVAFAFQRDLPGAFLAGVCWTGAGLVLQQAGIYAGLFFLAAWVDIAFSSKPMARRLSRAGALALGTVPLALCFLWGIGWDLPRFWNTYAVTLKGAAGVADSRATLLATYYQCIALGWEWILFVAVIPLFLVLIAAVPTLRDRLARGFVVAIVAGLVINVLLVRGGLYRVVFMHLIVALPAYCLLGGWRRHAQGLRLGLAVLCPGLGLAVTLPSLIAHFSQMPDNVDAVRRALVDCKPLAIYFNDSVSWNVYGWRLPSEAQSLDCSRIAVPQPPRDGEIYVIEEFEYRKFPLRFLGREFRSVPLNAHRYEVVDYRGISLLSGEPIGVPTDFVQRAAVAGPAVFTTPITSEVGGKKYIGWKR